MRKLDPDLQTCDNRSAPYIPMAVTSLLRQHATEACLFHSQRSRTFKRPKEGTAAIIHVAWTQPPIPSKHSSHWHVQRRQHRFFKARNAASLGAGSVQVHPAKTQPDSWPWVAGICGIAMLLCSAHRNVFTMLTPLLAQQFSLSVPQLGVLNAVMLLGYLIGQVPAGQLADTYGGERVLLAGLFVWSFATAATAVAVIAQPSHVFGLIAASRFSMGLFSAAAMPAVSAMASVWVPATAKASTLSIIYSGFNLGGVLGLVLTPQIAAACGWPSAFLAAAAAGVVWALIGWTAVKHIAADAHPHRQPVQHSAAAELSQNSEAVAVDAAVSIEAEFDSMLAHTRLSSMQTEGHRYHSATPGSELNIGTLLSRKPQEVAVGSDRAQLRCGSTAAVLDAPLQDSSAFGDTDFTLPGTVPPPSRGIPAGNHANGHNSVHGEGQSMRVHAANGHASATSRLARQPQRKPSTTPAPSSVSSDPLHGLSQLLVLCWSHAVLGFGFFIMSSWIPLYIKSLGVETLSSTGLLAGLPFLAAAAVGTVVGSLADTLVRRGTARLRVRHIMHAASTLGYAACLVPLAMSSMPSPALATGCLMAAMAANSFSFAGFHAYVQDVIEPESAGVVLGITNSCSIAMGIAGNLLTGYLVHAFGSYQLVFAATGVLFISSCALFVSMLHGQPLRLRALLAEIRARVSRVGLLLTSRKRRLA